MSSDVVIRVENLGKRYRIRHQQQGGMRYKALRDVLADSTKSLTRRLWSLTSILRPPSSGSAPSSVLRPPASEDFWALKDVSFSVRQGESVGIIGRNGAGKSTLLKVLSRITEPTEGRVRIKGRVASLLEVGTGFHPELTGRENIILNGAILGMSRAEVRKKFDEIVAFAEVEKFLDTPVKRYSSGMYVRLAFAVAAHLEPEILIVDEVLAVGDVQFQKKCLGKMDEVTKGGRTVLFVSHNMSAIAQLCSISVLMDRSRLSLIDRSSVTIAAYLAVGNQRTCSVDLKSYAFRTGTQDVTFDWAELRNPEGVPCRQFSIGDDIAVSFEVKSHGKYTGSMVKLSLEMRASDGLKLCNMVDTDSGFQIQQMRETETLSVCIKDVRLYPDTYYLTLYVGNMAGNEIYDRAEDCLSFEIISQGRLTTRPLPRSAGLLFLTPEWRRETRGVGMSEDIRSRRAEVA